MSVQGGTGVCMGYEKTGAAVGAGGNILSGAMSGSIAIGGPIGASWWVG